MGVFCASEQQCRCRKTVFEIKRGTLLLFDTYLTSTITMRTLALAARHGAQCISEIEEKCHVEETSHIYEHPVQQQLDVFGEAEKYLNENVWA